MSTIIIRESERDKLRRQMEQALLAEVMNLRLEHSDISKWHFGDLARGTIDRWLKDWRMVRR